MSIFSMAGLPPFMGFFGKFFVFYNLLLEHNFFLAGFAILISVLSAVYYIRLLRFLYFNKEALSPIYLILQPSRIICYFIVLTFYLNIFFLIYQNIILSFIQYNLFSFYSLFYA
jgi:NADH-quinone oxidoreductase subunit N